MQILVRWYPLHEQRTKIRAVFGGWRLVSDPIGELFSSCFYAGERRTRTVRSG